MKRARSQGVIEKSPPSPNGSDKIDASKKRKNDGQYSLREIVEADTYAYPNSNLMHVYILAIQLSVVQSLSTRMV